MIVEHIVLWLNTLGNGHREYYTLHETPLPYDEAQMVAKSSNKEMDSLVIVSVGDMKFFNIVNAETLKG
jgi:hypothetical protein